MITTIIALASDIYELLMLYCGYLICHQRNAHLFVSS